MSEYNQLFSLCDLYTEGCPAVIEKGVLFENVETKRVHIQLKFQRISEEPLSMLKVRLTLSDSIDRILGSAEKQYIDIKANLGETFGGEVPIFLENNIVRKFSVAIEEVCFANGQIWNPPTDCEWAQIPEPQNICTKLTSEEALKEYKIVSCSDAKVVPFEYKDLWVCACGKINRKDRSACYACNAKRDEITEIDNESLKNDGMYREACLLAEKENSNDIEKSIHLFEEIVDWKDSREKAEYLKPICQKFKNEERKKALALETAQKKKSKKIKGAIIALCAVVVASVICTSIIIVGAKENNYNIAKDYIAKNEYSAAIDVLNKIKGYKDADKLCRWADLMARSLYGRIALEEGLTSFEIPDGVTSIGYSAFSGCSGLTSITIPDRETCSWGTRVIIK